MPDNVLNITVTANTSALRAAMADASKIVGAAVSDIRTAAQSLPSAMNVAVDASGSALALFGAKVQEQAARVLDLKTALSQVSAALRETEAMVREAGGATQVGASIIQQYSRETVAQAVLQNQLTEAVAEYKTMLNEANAAQLRVAASASIAGVAGAAVVGGGAAEGGAPAGEQTLVAAEAMTAAREAETAALDAETTAQDSANVARETEAAVTSEASAATEVNTAATMESATAEQRQAAFIEQNLRAKNAIAAATAQGSAAIAEYAAATAHLNAVDRITATTEEEVAAKMDAKTAAMARLKAANIAFVTDEQAATAQTQQTTAALLGQAPASEIASAAQMRLAQATVASSTARSELNAAEEMAVTVGASDADAMNALAVAQGRAATAAVELAAAQKAVDAEINTGAGVLSLFRQRLIIGENGIRAFVTTGLTSVPLLIGAIVTGFAIRAVEAMREFELEMQNLSQATGETVSYLASMSQAAEVTGAKADDMTRMFRFLDRTISDAASGSESARLTLRELGVDMTLINEGVIPKTNTVLSQMADYLHENSANAETMRAATHALGSSFGDSAISMVGFLSQGSVAIKQQSEGFAGYGQKVQDAEEHTKSLSAQLAKTSAIWKEIKIDVLEAADDLAIYGTKALEFIGESIPLEQGLEGILGLWNEIKVVTDAAAKSNDDYMKSAAKTLFAPPAPPYIAHEATGKKADGTLGATPSAMPGIREELSNQEAAFDGSRAEMLRMEVNFWDQVIETGRVKGKDLIAAHVELTRSEIALRNEERSSATAQARDMAGLAKEGTADRVSLEQQAADQARVLYGEDSNEYRAAQEQLSLAKRAQVEEEVRLTDAAVQQEISKYKEADGHRVALYDLQLTVLRSYLTEAEAASRSSSEAERIIARGESDFIIAEIRRMMAERSKSAKAEAAEASSEQAKGVEKLYADRIKLIQEADKVSETMFAAEKARINDLASKDLISAATKIKMLEQVEAAEYKVGVAALASEKAQLEAEAAAVKGIAGQEAKYRELQDAIQKIDGKIVELAAKRDAQIMTNTQKLTDGMTKLYLTAFDAMERAFKTATDGMIAGTLTFSQGMQRIWGSIVIALRDAAIQMVLEWAKHEAAKLIISLQASVAQKTLHQAAAAQQTTLEIAQTAIHGTQETAKVAATAAGQAGQTAATQIGASTRTNIGIIEDLKSIARAAAVAAAHAFKWVMEVVPFPINYPMAAAAAAATFAGVMAFDALASAAGGAVIPHDMVMKVHENEWVLPSRISQGLNTMISSGQAGGGAGGAGMGMGLRINYAPVVHTMDARGMHDILSEHAGVLTSVIRREIRRGK